MNDHDGTPIEFILSHDEASPGPPIFLNDGRKVYWTDGVVFTHPDGRRTFHDYSPLRVVQQRSNPRECTAHRHLTAVP